MINSKSILGIVFLVAAQWTAVVACSSTAGGDGSGGGSASGGTNSGGSSSGGAASGGSGGSVPPCENFHPDEGECGTCEQSLEEFCQNAGADCTMPDDLICKTRLPTVWLYEGCGYVRRRSYGDTDADWIHVWSKATGELVAYSSHHIDASPCSPPIIVGEMPDCDWENACDGFGGEGAEGGGAP